MRAGAVVALMLLLVLGVTSVGSAVPSLMTYQGALTDSAGKPANGTYAMTFEMYAGKTGGAAVWSETIANVTVKNGIFTVLLGAASALPAGMKDCTWLQVTVNGTPMLPRQRVSSVAYALEAGNAASLGGAAASSYRDASRLTAGTLPVGRLPQVPVSKLGLGSQAKGTVDGPAFAVINESATGVAMKGLASAQTGATVGVHGGNWSREGIGVRGQATAESGATRGVYGEVASGAGIGVYGESLAAQGGRGVYGHSRGGGGAGVLGEADATLGYGVMGSAPAFGVFGRSLGTSGTGRGVVGTAESPEGIGVQGSAPATSGPTKGVAGTVASPDGLGVMGVNTAPDGGGAGVYGEMASPGGHGVQGKATATSGNATGVFGETWSPSGSGVTGFNQGGGNGVSGNAIGASSTHSGVYGTTESPSGFGVRGMNNSSGGVGVRGESNGGWGVYGTGGSSGWGVHGKGLSGVVGESEGDGYGVAGFTGGKNAAVFGESTGSGPSVAGRAGGSNAAVFGENTGSGPGVEARSARGVALDVQGYARVIGTQDGLYVEATDTEGAIALTVGNGKSLFLDNVDFYGFAMFWGGFGDLAESYRGRGVEAGDVVVLAPGGELARCTKESDTSVAGIISTQPSMKLAGGLKDGEGVVPLALVGRVACKVDATKRPIRVGDLLTTSRTPGHAMKCASKRPAAGTVIGKALESLDSGKGVIQVLVSPR